MTDRALLTGWLLALLAAEEDCGYGYDLRAALRTHGVEADPSAVYRTLRALDADGMLRSRWAPSSDGPRRRLYRITDAGRERLATFARDVARDDEARRAKVAGFLRFVGVADTDPRIVEEMRRAVAALGCVPAEFRAIDEGRSGSPPHCCAADAKRAYDRHPNDAWTADELAAIDAKLNAR